MKRLIFCFFLLIAAGVNAGPVQNRLDTLQFMCFYQLRTDTAGTASMTKDMVRFALNRGLARVCREFPALEKLDTVYVSDTAEGVVLNSDFLRIRQVFKLTGNTRIPLDFVPREKLFDLTATENEYTHIVSNVTQPRYVYTHGNRLHFYPKDAYGAAAPDSFLVYYWAMDVELTAASDTASIAVEYLDALLYAALAELSAMKRDYTSAKFYWQRFEAEKGNVQPREAELKK